MPRPHIEHGGALAHKKRRSRRPLKIKKPLHVTMRSHLAKGSRSLLKNKSAVYSVLISSSRKFRIRIYRIAVCGNHLHLLVRGQKRVDIQNFFRVATGHIAQKILKSHPLQPAEVRWRERLSSQRREALSKPQHPKNRRVFWDALLYSRILSGWGNEFRVVAAYIEQNVLEALGIIPYQPRKTRFSSA
jgi:REP element-mobilizing transposase RayT